MKWITRSRGDWKRLPVATVCASRVIWTTCSTSLKFTTRCMRGAGWTWRGNKSKWI